MSWLWNKTLHWAYLIYNGLHRACRSSTDRPGIDNKGVFVLYCQVGYEFPTRGSKISLILSLIKGFIDIAVYVLWIDNLT